MSVRSYVESNFSETEKFIFDYIINSFPETVLNIYNPTSETYKESQELLAIIGLLAKAVGGSRELIQNLTNSHSLKNLYSSIESNSSLSENNKKILYLLADMGGYPVVGDYSDIDDILSSRDLILYYNVLSKNKTSIYTAIEALKRYSRGLGASIGGVETYQSSGTTYFNVSDIPLEDADIDTTYNGALGIENPLIFDGSQYFPIKKDSALYQLLRQFTPAGLVYLYITKLVQYVLYNTMLTNPVTYINEQLYDSPYYNYGSIWTATFQNAILSGSTEYSIIINNYGKTPLVGYILATYGVIDSGYSYPEETMIPFTVAAGTNKPISFPLSSIDESIVQVSVYCKPYFNTSDQSYVVSPVQIYDRAAETPAFVEPTVAYTKSGNFVSFTVKNENTYTLYITNQYVVITDPVLPTTPSWISLMTLTVTAGATSPVQSLNLVNNTQLNRYAFLRTVSRATIGGLIVSDIVTPLGIVYPTSGLAQ